MTDPRADLERVKSAFELKSGLIGVETKVVERQPRPALIIYVSQPTERLYKILEDVLNESRNDDNDDDENPIVTIKSKSHHNILDSSEIKLFLRVLSESQNVNRYSFPEDFFDRYTHSVSGSEAQIISNANHIVLGRRGAGKSMLLLYAWHERKRQLKPSIWVDMQVYSGRNDELVVRDVLKEILIQVEPLLASSNQYKQAVSSVDGSVGDLGELRMFLPVIRKYLEAFATRQEELFVFIDDLHAVADKLQPSLLDMLYGLSRGNQIFLKISAIETLTRTYDPQLRQGLEIPQDAQNLKLDYNLTMPDKTAEQIGAILDAHAKYAGMPSIRRLCSSIDVLPRLTWVSAGVPRDALNLFAQAISKAISEDRKRVTVSNVNVAASETLTTKLHEFNVDASDRSAPLTQLFESIRRFCVEEKRKNAFLVEVNTEDDLYSNVMSLVQLRLLHIISEGITVGKVGRKYIGLILDYGLYTGIRAAQSVDLFNRQTGKVAYRDLRALPVFKG